MSGAAEFSPSNEKKIKFFRVKSKAKKKKKCLAAKGVPIEPIRWNIKSDSIENQEFM